MNNKILIDLNRLLNTLHLDYIYTIDDNKIKLVVFMEE